MMTTVNGGYRIDTGAHKMDDRQIIMFTNEEVKMMLAMFLFAKAMSGRPKSDPFYEKYEQLESKLKAAYEAIEE